MQEHGSLHRGLCCAGRASLIALCGSILRSNPLRFVYRRTERAPSCVCGQATTAPLGLIDHPNNFQQIQMQVDHVRFLLVEGHEVCTAKRAMVSSYKIVADHLEFADGLGADFLQRLGVGERFPVVAYIGDETERVVGEAFIHDQTADRLHVGIWRSYVLNATTGRWE